MVRLILILGLLASFGCFDITPKFKAGDCIKMIFPDGKIFDNKIEKVNEKTYRTYFGKFDIDVVDKVSEKVNCD